MAARTGGAPGTSRCTSEEMSADLFHALATHSAEIVIIYGNEGTISYVPPSVERVTSCQPANLTGASGPDLSHSGSLTADIREIVRALVNGDIVTREWHLRRADGTWGWYEFTLTDNPAIGGIVGTFRDVTERHELDRPHDKATAGRPA